MNKILPKESSLRQILFYNFFFIHGTPQFFFNLAKDQRGEHSNKVQSSDGAHACLLVKQNARSAHLKKK